MHDRVMQYMYKCLLLCVHWLSRIWTNKEQRMGARMQGRSRLCMPGGTKKRKENTVSAPIKQAMQVMKLQAGPPHVKRESAQA